MLLLKSIKFTYLYDYIVLDAHEVGVCILAVVLTVVVPLDQAPWPASRFEFVEHLNCFKEVYDRRTKCCWVSGRYV